MEGEKSINESPLRGRERKSAISFLAVFLAGCLITLNDKTATSQRYDNVMRRFVVDARPSASASAMGHDDDRKATRQMDGWRTRGRDLIFPGRNTSLVGTIKHDRVSGASISVISSRRWLAAGCDTVIGD